MDILNTVKIISKKILVAIILFFLFPLFIIRAGIWLIKMFYNDQEAIKELHYYEQE